MAPFIKFLRFFAAAGITAAPRGIAAFSGVASHSRYQFHRISRPDAYERVTEFMILCETPDPLWDVYLSFLLGAQTDTTTCYAAHPKTRCKELETIPAHHPLWVTVIDHDVASLLPHPLLTQEHGDWANCSVALKGIEESLGRTISVQN